MHTMREYTQLANQGDELTLKIILVLTVLDVKLFRSLDKRSARQISTGTNCNYLFSPVKTHGKPMHIV